MNADQSPIERARAIVEAMTSGEYRADSMEMSKRDWQTLNGGDLAVVRRGIDVIASVWSDDDGEDAANAEGFVFASSLARVLVAEETVEAVARELAPTAWKDMEKRAPNGRWPDAEDYEPLKIAKARHILSRLAALALGASHAER